MRLKQVFAGTSQKKKAAPTVSFCYFNEAIVAPDTGKFSPIL